MQDSIKPAGEESAGFGGFVEKLGSSIRRSRIGIFSKPPVHALLPITTPSVEEEQLPQMEDSTEDEPAIIRGRYGVKEVESKEEEVGVPPPIRWRKGELIGCSAFGRVHMGMNLDSGELLAVKEVSIAASSASKKTQEYIGELEKEVNLLKNLSHPNIVRYLGTAREEDSLYILLEFVPGGSISSLLGKFGPFPESVIRMYTKQLLVGLEYLHKNKIMHRDIKGANILVDNKACIKLADFGASKKVEALATITGAKSMKGTPYWMAPEVIVQSGHSYSADIWSVGCTVIEMATGKAPWSQQYQEVAALFYVGTTKSHPPIPDDLSAEAKDFLLKCLQEEPHLRATASELLKHPFVTGESPGTTRIEMEILPNQTAEPGSRSLGSVEVDCGFTFPRGPSGSEDEVTEAKIRAFLDETALDLKKLQTPLFALNVGGIGNKENVSSICNLPPKSSKFVNRRFSTAPDVEYSFRVSQGVKEQSFDHQPQPLTPSSRFSETKEMEGRT